MECIILVLYKLNRQAQLLSTAILNTVYQADLQSLDDKLYRLR